MGRDKARLPFRGRPMVEVAVGKLRSFCADVSVSGNRDDLGNFAPVVSEARAEAGPGAGIEAALRACTQPWALFVPVDVPLVPEALLRFWAIAVVREAAPRRAASFLLVNGDKQPAFCMLRPAALPGVSAALDRGVRRLDELIATASNAAHGALWVVDAARFLPDAASQNAESLRELLGSWFRNANTPEELAAAERVDAPLALDAFDILGK